MSNSLTITVDISRAQAGFRRAPEVMTRVIGKKILDGAEEVAIKAKLLAPSVSSNLANSIRAERIGPLHYRVSAGVNYARGVEEGTGPAAGKARYYPNPDNLLQYLQSTPSARGRLARFIGPMPEGSWQSSFGTSGELARPGSKRRNSQEYELWHRSRAMAWAIYNKGTRPNPFMKPAAEGKRSRLFELVQAGVDEGLHEVFA